MSVPEDDLVANKHLEELNICFENAWAEARTLPVFRDMLHAVYEDDPTNGAQPELLGAKAMSSFDEAPDEQQDIFLYMLWVLSHLVNQHGVVEPLSRLSTPDISQMSIEEFQVIFPALRLFGDALRDDCTGFIPRNFFCGAKLFTQNTLSSNSAMKVHESLTKSWNDVIEKGQLPHHCLLSIGDFNILRVVQELRNKVFGKLCPLVSQAEQEVKELFATWSDLLDVDDRAAFDEFKELLVPTIINQNNQPSRQRSAVQEAKFHRPFPIPLPPKFSSSGEDSAKVHQLLHRLTCSDFALWAHRFKKSRESHQTDTHRDHSSKLVLDVLKLSDDKAKTREDYLWRNAKLKDFVEKCESKCLLDVDLKLERTYRSFCDTIRQDCFQTRQAEALAEERNNPMLLLLDLHETFEISGTPVSLGGSATTRSTPTTASAAGSSAPPILPLPQRDAGEGGGDGLEDNAEQHTRAVFLYGYQAGSSSTSKRMRYSVPVKLADKDGIANIEVRTVALPLHMLYLLLDTRDSEEYLRKLSSDETNEASGESMRRRVVLSFCNEQEFGVYSQKSSNASSRRPTHWEEMITSLKKEFSDLIISLEPESGAHENGSDRIADGPSNLRLSLSSCIVKERHSVASMTSVVPMPATKSVIRVKMGRNETELEECITIASLVCCSNVPESVSTKIIQRFYDTAHDIKSASLRTSARTLCDAVMVKSLTHVWVNSEAVDDSDASEARSSRPLATSTAPAMSLSSAFITEDFRELLKVLPKNDGSAAAREHFSRILYIAFPGLLHNLSIHHFFQYLNSDPPTWPTAAVMPSFTDLLASTPFMRARNLNNTSLRATSADVADILSLLYSGAVSSAVFLIRACHLKILNMAIVDFIRTPFTRFVIDGNNFEGALVMLNSQFPANSWDGFRLLLVDVQPSVAPSDLVRLLSVIQRPGLVSFLIYNAGVVAGLRCVDRLCSHAEWSRSGTDNSSDIDSIALSRVLLTRLTPESTDRLIEFDSSDRAISALFLALNASASVAPEAIVKACPPIQKTLLPPGAETSAWRERVGDFFDLDVSTADDSDFSSYIVKRHDSASLGLMILVGASPEFLTASLEAKPWANTLFEVDSSLRSTSSSSATSHKAASQRRSSFAPDSQGDWTQKLFSFLETSRDPCQPVRVIVHKAHLLSKKMRRDIVYAAIAASTRTRGLSVRLLFIEPAYNPCYETIFESSDFVTQATKNGSAALVTNDLHPLWCYAASPIDPLPQDATDCMILVWCVRRAFLLLGSTFVAPSHSDPAQQENLGPSSTPHEALKTAATNLPDSNKLCEFFQTYPHALTKLAMLTSNLKQSHNVELDELRRLVVFSASVALKAMQNIVPYVVPETEGRPVFATLAMATLAAVEFVGQQSASKCVELECTFPKFIERWPLACIAPQHVRVAAYVSFLKCAIASIRGAHEHDQACSLWAFNVFRKAQGRSFTSLLPNFLQPYVLSRRSASETGNGNDQGSVGYLLETTPLATSSAASAGLAHLVIMSGRLDYNTLTDSWNNFAYGSEALLTILKSGNDPLLYLLCVSSASLSRIFPSPHALKMKVTNDLRRRLCEQLCALSAYFQYEEEARRRIGTGGDSAKPLAERLDWLLDRISFVKWLLVASHLEDAPSVAFHSDDLDRVLARGHVPLDSGDSNLDPTVIAMLLCLDELGSNSGESTTLFQSLKEVKLSAVWLLLAREDKGAEENARVRLQLGEAWTKSLNESLSARDSSADHLTHPTINSRANVHFDDRSDTSLVDYVVETLLNLPRLASLDQYSLVCDMSFKFTPKALARVCLHLETLDRVDQAAMLALVHDNIAATEVYRQVVEVACEFPTLSRLLKFLNAVVAIVLRCGFEDWREPKHLQLLLALRPSFALPVALLEFLLMCLSRDSSLTCLLSGDSLPSEWLEYYAKRSDSVLSKAAQHALEVLLTVQQQSTHPTALLHDFALKSSSPVAMALLSLVWANEPNPMQDPRDRLQFVGKLVMDESTADSIVDGAMALMQQSLVNRHCWSLRSLAIFASCVWCIFPCSGFCPPLLVWHYLFDSLEASAEEAGDSSAESADPILLLLWRESRTHKASYDHATESYTRMGDIAKAVFLPMTADLSVLSAISQLLPDNDALQISTISSTTKTHPDESNVRALAHPLWSWNDFGRSDGPLLALLSRALNELHKRDAEWWPRGPPSYVDAFDEDTVSGAEFDDYQRLWGSVRRIQLDAGLSVEVLANNIDAYASALALLHTPERETDRDAFDNCGYTLENALNAVWLLSLWFARCGISWELIPPSCDAIPDFLVRRLHEKHFEGLTAVLETALDGVRDGTIHQLPQDISTRICGIEHMSVQTQLSFHATNESNLFDHGLSSFSYTLGRLFGFAPRSLAHIIVGDGNGSWPRYSRHTTKRERCENLLPDCTRAMLDFDEQEDECRFKVRTVFYYCTLKDTAEALYPDQDFPSVVFMKQYVFDPVEQWMKTCDFDIASHKVRRRTAKFMLLLEELLKAQGQFDHVMEFNNAHKFESLGKEWRSSSADVKILDSLSTLYEDAKAQEPRIANDELTLQREMLSTILKKIYPELTVSPESAAPHVEFEPVDDDFDLSDLTSVAEDDTASDSTDVSEHDTDIDYATLSPLARVVTVHGDGEQEAQGGATSADDHEVLNAAKVRWLSEGKLIVDARELLFLPETGAASSEINGAPEHVYFKRMRVRDGAQCFLILHHAEALIREKATCDAFHALKGGSAPRDTSCTDFTYVSFCNNVHNVCLKDEVLLTFATYRDAWIYLDRTLGARSLVVGRGMSLYRNGGRSWEGVAFMQSLSPDNVISFISEIDAMVPFLPGGIAGLLGHLDKRTSLIEFIKTLVVKLVRGEMLSRDVTENDFTHYVNSKSTTGLDESDFGRLWTKLGVALRDPVWLRRIFSIGSETEGFGELGKLIVGEERRLTAPDLFVLRMGTDSGSGATEVFCDLLRRRKDIELSYHSMAELPVAVSFSSQILKRCELELLEAKESKSNVAFQLKELKGWLLDVLSSPLLTKTMKSFLVIVDQGAKGTCLPTNIAEQDRFVAIMLARCCPVPKLRDRLLSFVDTGRSNKDHSLEQTCTQRRDLRYGVVVCNDLSEQLLTRPLTASAVVVMNVKNETPKDDALFLRIVSKFDSNFHIVYVHGLRKASDILLKWCCEYTYRWPWRFIFFQELDIMFNFPEIRDRIQHFPVDGLDDSRQSFALVEEHQWVRAHEKLPDECAAAGNDAHCAPATAGAEERNEDDEDDEDDGVCDEDGDNDGDLNLFDWQEKAKKLLVGASSCVLLLTSPPGTGKTFFARDLLKEVDEKKYSETVVDARRFDCSDDRLVVQSLSHLLDEAFPSQGQRGLLIADEFHLLKPHQKRELFSWFTPRLSTLRVLLIGNRQLREDIQLISDLKKEQEPTSKGTPRRDGRGVADVEAQSCSSKTAPGCKVRKLIATLSPKRIVNVCLNEKSSLSDDEKFALEWWYTLLLTLFGPEALSLRDAFYTSQKVALPLRNSHTVQSNTAESLRKRLLVNMPLMSAKMAGVLAESFVEAVRSDNHDSRSLPSTTLLSSLCRVAIKVSRPLDKSPRLTSFVAFCRTELMQRYDPATRAKEWIKRVQNEANIEASCQIMPAAPNSMWIDQDPVPVVMDESHVHSRQRAVVQQAGALDAAKSSGVHLAVGLVERNLTLERLRYLVVHSQPVNWVYVQRQWNTFSPVTDLQAYEELLQACSNPILCLQALACELLDASPDIDHDRRKQAESHFCMLAERSAERDRRHGMGLIASKVWKAFSLKTKLNANELSDDEAVSVEKSVGALGHSTVPQMYAVWRGLVLCDHLRDVSVSATSPLVIDTLLWASISEDFSNVYATRDKTDGVETRVKKRIVPLLLNVSRSLASWWLQSKDTAKSDKAAKLLCDLWRRGVFRQLLSTSVVHRLDTSSLLCLARHVTSHLLDGSPWLAATSKLLNSDNQRDEDSLAGFCNDHDYRRCMRSASETMGTQRGLRLVADLACAFVRRQSGAKTSYSSVKESFRTLLSGKDLTTVAINEDDLQKLRSDQIVP